MTDLIGFINLFSGFAQILMGFFVLISGFRSKVKRIYFLSVLFLGLWSLSLYFYANPIFFDTTIWLKIVYTMAYCMTLGLILFARVYPKELKEKFKVFFVIILLYMILMSLILWFTDLIVISTYSIHLQFNSIAQMGPLYLWYGMPEFVTAIYVVGYYVKQANVLSGIEKRQVQFYVVGGVIMLIPVFIFDFLLPLVFKDTSFYKFSTLGNVVWTMIVGYSILTTRFLDVRVVVGSAISTFLKTIFTLGALLLVIYVFEPLWGITFSLQGIIKLFVISIVVTLVLNKIFSVIENFLSDHFIYVKYNPVKSLRDFVGRNSETLDIKKISANLINLINASFKPSMVEMILFDSKGEIFVNEGTMSPNTDTDEVLNVLDSWRKLNSNRILVFSELQNYQRAGKQIIDQKRYEILSFMKKNGIEIIFSIREKNKFEGMVMIGENQDRNSYTVGDMDFLDNVMQNCHMALVRSTLYLELQSFNQTLQEKVNEQTKELQVKVEELEDARRKERDMIDIMGHELRTPATIVKLNAGLLEKYINSNPADFKKYLDRIKGSIENEIKLINTLLTSAKLEGNRVEICNEAVSVKDEIEMVVHGHEIEAQKKDLVLINQVLPDTPAIFADKVRTIEIIDNLVGNAIKYTKQGSVTIQTEYDDENVKVSVTDTGDGIPQEEIAKLGQKFHRVDNYTGNGSDVEIVRPGGTGLGLFVVFGLVNLMNGKIWVESEVGKGSKFIFTLPRFKGQEVKVTHTESKSMFERMGLKR
jgi:signal transduction histidine kinase